MNTDEMKHAKVDDVLRETDTGVVSLTDGTETYAIPEPFGYDGDVCYFRFGSEDDSHTLSVVDTTETAVVTVSTEDPKRTVIVRGTLEEVPSEARSDATAALEANATASMDTVSSDTGSTERSVQLYRLIPESITGRAVGTERANPMIDLPPMCREHLEKAAQSETCSEKDFHIRQILQACSPVANPDTASGVSD